MVVLKTRILPRFSARTKTSHPVYVTIFPYVKPEFDHSLLFFAQDFEFEDTNASPIDKPNLEATLLDDEDFRGDSPHGSGEAEGSADFSSPGPVRPTPSENPGKLLVVSTFLRLGVTRQCVVSYHDGKGSWPSSQCYVIYVMVSGWFLGHKNLAGGKENTYLYMYKQTRI